MSDKQIPEEFLGEISRTLFVQKIPNISVDEISILFKDYDIVDREL